MAVRDALGGDAPILMASMKLGPALAAGNAVILKPAEDTPWSITRVAELVKIKT